MNEVDVLALANQAGLYMTSIDRIEAVKRFANLVAEKEREACAQLCEGFATNLRYEYAHQYAEAIRARGQK